MNFDYTDDQQAIKSTANEFLTARYKPEKLRELAEAGVDRVMLQHLLHQDVEMVELIGREIIPALA